MKRHLLTLALTVFTLMTWAQNLVTETTLDNVTYNLYDDGTATMTKHSTPEGGTLLVPESVDYEGKTYMVTTIADGALSSSNYIKKLIVKAPVKTLGKITLLMIYLEEVELPETLERIEPNQFARTRIKTLTIPKNVKFIGGDAFSESDIETVAIPEGVESLPARVFARCSNLKSVSLPKSLKVIKGGSETSICEGAFAACSALTEMILPDNMEEIGSDAFYGCNSLTHFSAKGDAYFDRDGVLMHRLPDSEGGGLLLIQYPAGRDASEYTVDDDVTSIGKYAFYWWRTDKLQTVNLPKSIKCVQGFYHTKVKNVNIAEGPTEIADKAFYWAEGMHVLKLPKSIQKIGKDAFYNTTLQRVYVEATTPPTLDADGAYDFLFCVNQRALSTYKYTDIWKLQQLASTANLATQDNLVYLKEDDGTASLIGFEQRPTGKLTFPSQVSVAGKSSTVTSVGAKAFYTADITEVVLPATVKTLKASAFNECKNLQTVEIAAESQLETIGRAAFGQCESLKEIHLPATVKTLTDYAFSSCQKLEKITFGENSQLESIGYGAFSYNYALKTIRLEAQTKVYDSSFEGCWNLEKIEVDAANPYYIFKDDALYTVDGKKMIAYASGCGHDTFMFAGDNLTNVEYFCYDPLVLKKVYFLTKTLPYIYIIRVRDEYATRYNKPIIYVRQSIADELRRELDYPWGSSLYNLVRRDNIVEISDEEADAILTGIETPQVAAPSADHDAYYTLDGKRIQHPQNGVYIHNGRKVIIK